VVGAGNAFDVVWKNIQGFKKIFSGQVRADKALSGHLKLPICMVHTGIG
jgi:regulator of sigma E protease